MANTDLVTLVQEQRGTFMQVAVDKDVNFDREAAFAIQLLNSSDYLAKLAMGNRPSLVAAVNNVAAIGITLNPAQKLAYLVPRDGKVCLDISYMGLLHIAQVSGAIKWGQAVIVRKNDTFVMRGIDKEPEHIYSPFDTDRGEIIGCYVVVKTDSDDYLTHAMSANQINAIRDRSTAWKAYVKDKSKTCPWVTDYEEMAKKTVVKQAAKYWPRRDRLDSAVHYMNTDGGEGALVGSGMTPEAVAEHLKSIAGALTTESLKDAYKAAVSSSRDCNDMDAYEKFKSAMLKAGSALVDKEQTK